MKSPLPTPIFCVAIAVIVLAIPSVSQVATGRSDFGSYGGGPFDVVDLGNLNTSFTIPIVHKSGRGLPFIYDLIYNSSVWYPVTSGSTTSWTPVANWGWTSNWGGVTGYLTYSSPVTYCYDGQGHPDGETVYYQDWVYHDSWSGRTHGFAGYMVIYSGGCSGTSIYSFTSAANDNSGLTLSVNNAIGTIITKEGISMIPPTSAPTGPVSAPKTDDNGNQITSTTAGVFTDTLGTTALTITGANPVNFSYTAPGGTATYAVHYGSYNIKTNFGCSGVSGEYTATGVSLVSSISLPDGSQYSFIYEGTPGSSGYYTARLHSVTLPTGGSITYTYTGSNNGIVCADGSAAGLTRAVSPGGTWTYARSGSGNAWVTTITDPTSAQNQTVINFSKDVEPLLSLNFFETQRQIYQGAAGGTLLLATLTCYNTNFSGCATAPVNSPISQKDVFTEVGSNNSLVERVYDTMNGGRLTATNEYDYGVSLNSAPSNTYLVRSTGISYASLGSIINRPSSVSVSNQAGTQVALTTYTYDEGTTTPTSGTPNHISITGSRGNVTTAATKANSTTTLYRKFTYYDTGMPNNSTSFDTSSATTCANKPSICTTYNYSSVSASCGNFFVTSVSEPLSLSRSMVWNCTGGVMTAMTDENTKTVSASFTTDTHFWRPESTTDQLTNVTNYSYPSSTAVESSMLFNSNNSTADLRATVDGFGRPILSQIGQTPAPSNYDSVQTDYDVAGRIADVIRPFAAARSTLCTGTCKETTVTYDGLNRPLVVTDAGTGTVTYAYTNIDVSQTIGPPPTGENTKQRQMEYDGLGRLKSVCEVTTASGSGACAQISGQTGYWTEYTYDALGDMVGVTQNAQAASGSRQTRTYAFDMMRRLTSELNPETGTSAIAYTYDTLSGDASCGTVTSAGDLLKKVDAMGNVTCYQYDAWHRVTSLTYPTGTYHAATPTKCYVYDAATVNGTAMSNAKTRLAEAYTTASTCAASKLTDEGFSYSARGETTDVWESTPHSSGYYHLTSQYWANGRINTLSGLPGLTTMTYGVDGEGRTSTVSAASGQNPVTASSYNVAHQVTGVTYGSLDSDAFTFDPSTGRMTQYQFKMGTGPTTDTGALTWNPNGSLQKLLITDNVVSANSQTCTYSQDDLMRITSANCGSVWAQTFSFDPFGNLSKSGSASFLPTYTGSSGTGTSPTNQYYPVSSYYDTNGNLTSDAAHTYTWDADAKNISVDGSTVGMTYDALDRMVEQTRGSAHTEIVYTPQGLKMALMNGQTLVNAFVKLPGGGRAVYNSSGLAYYRHKDHLGSSRLATTPTRTKYYDVAYGPYGEDYNGSGTTTDLSFTDQNQDTVSGGWTANLYDFMFREYRTGHGRWTSPDPAGLAAVDASNPQSWNRYAYVNNNPLSYIDPDGTSECGEGTDCCDADCIVDGGAGDEFAAGRDPNNPNGDCNGPCIPFAYIFGNCTVSVTYSSVESSGYTYDSPNFSTSCSGGSNWVANNGFTLGIRAPGQTYSQCLASNTRNYSIAGVFNIQNGAGKFLAGNDAGNLLFGDASEGQAGLLLSHGGASAVSAGVGTAGTFGRRTASIFDLNLSGTTGPAPTILGKTGAEEVAGVLSGIAEIKFAIDVGLTGAEAIGCAFHR